MNGYVDVNTTVEKLESMCRPCVHEYSPSDIWAAGYNTAMKDAMIVLYMNAQLYNSSITTSPNIPYTPDTSPYDPSTTPWTVRPDWWTTSPTCGGENL